MLTNKERNAMNLNQAEANVTRFAETCIYAECQLPITVDRGERAGIEEYDGVAVFFAKDAEGEDICEVVVDDLSRIVRVFYAE
jgi:hypothetical protein